MALSRRQLLGGGGLATLAGALGFADPGLAAPRRGLKWAAEADVVVVGGGASGLPAAIAAREAGATVILVEAENHLGGHGICSGGNLPLGGGTPLQKKYGIVDSPDLVFRDLTDWSVVEPNGAADYRFNDREIIRAFADHGVATFNFLQAHGVKFIDKAPDNFGGESVGNSVPREAHCAVMDWPMVQTGRPAPAAVRATLSTGNGLMHPLAAATAQAGVRTLLGHKMTALRREGREGRVIGVTVAHGGDQLNLRARKAVILTTGGSSGNVNFRRMFDPRLTEEYCGIAGMPWSNQDASGELAAMAVGASLWGLANQTGEFGSNITKPGAVGCQYGYVHLRWYPGSEVFSRARAIGLQVRDWQDLILVNMLGRRFYDETGPQFTANAYDKIDPYTSYSYLNAKNIRWHPNNFIDAALAGIGDGHNGGGPIWAIFDADAVRRERWEPRPPHVDPEGFFFSANSLDELAGRIVMRYQRMPMPAQNLVATVARYNSFVDRGVDLDFGKPAPRYKIATPPFYAAWATPVIHDTRAGLRINRHCQVIDMSGQVIAGLYSAGETAGGFSLHGLARATCQGYIAGRHAGAQS